MNNQEREQLTQFLQQLGGVRLTDKDQEADKMIRDAAASQPDAAYLLVQRTLLLEQALNSAKAQIAELQNQLQNQSAATSRSGFLQNDPWAPATNPNSAAIPGAGNYQMPRYAAPAPVASGFGGAGSFLGNVATTAAGVVAGSFLFQGIENLIGGHHGSSSPWGGHDVTSQNDQPIESTTINNYYGDSADDSSQPDASFADYNADDSTDFADDNESDWI